MVQNVHVWSPHYCAHAHTHTHTHSMYMYVPLLPVALVRVDDATDHLLHEEPVDGVRRREGAARSLSELEVLLREEMKDGKWEGVDRVLRVNGNLDAG